MPNPIPVAIFLHPRASAGFALLAASVFRIANRVMPDQVYEIRLTGIGEHFICEDGEIRLTRWADCRRGGYLLIPPMDIFRELNASESAELDIVREASDTQTSIAAACLGSFLPAAAGLLDGRKATTHWDRADEAMSRFPAVRWDVREMLIDHGDIITAGGLLSIVDLCLYVVRKTAGQDCATLLGQRLLADTVRQKQSVYATKLIAPPKDLQIFALLEREIERLGPDRLSAAEMADFCGMSLRSFHRRFRENYGITPVKFLQLRRLEKAKALLAQSALSLGIIADRAGFGDMAFFRSVFSRETGMTPGQYRRRLAR